MGRVRRGGQDPGRSGGCGAVPGVPQDRRVPETHGFCCEEIGASECLCTWALQGSS